MMIGRGSSNDFEAVGATVMVTFVGFMDLNSPHQSSAFIVGQQLGLPAGGYLRQVLSALKTGNLCKNSSLSGRLRSDCLNLCAVDLGSKTAARQDSGFQSAISALHWSPLLVLLKKAIQTHHKRVLTTPDELLTLLDRPI